MLWIQKGLYPILDIDYCNLKKISPISLISIWQSFPQIIDSFQIRAKSISIKELESFYFDFRNFTKLKIIINDYWQEAIQWQADGIHLGKEDYLSLTENQKSEFKKFPSWKGTSSHSENDILNLENFWDYSGLGPIFPTVTKITINQPLGLMTLKHILKISKIPIVPIGGIDQFNFKSLINISNIKPASISLFSDQALFPKIAEEYIKNLA